MLSHPRLLTARGTGTSVRRTHSVRRPCERVRNPFGTTRREPSGARVSAHNDVASSRRSSRALRPIRRYALIDRRPRDLEVSPDGIFGAPRGIVDESQAHCLRNAAGKLGREAPGTTHLCGSWWAKAHLWKGVHYPGGRQPSGGEAVHPCPVDRRALIAALQRLVPELGHLGGERGTAAGCQARRSSCGVPAPRSPATIPDPGWADVGAP